MINDDELIEVLRNYNLTDPVQAVAAIRKVALAASIKEREACIEWLRNNYQDYTSISEICEAIRARGND